MAAARTGVRLRRHGRRQHEELCETTDRNCAGPAMDPHGSIRFRGGFIAIDWLVGEGDLAGYRIDPGDFVFGRHRHQSSVLCARDPQHPMVTPDKPETASRTWFGVHPDVLKLGLVSLLTDISSELIFSVFAIFFTTIAGASAALLGAVEGFADLSASSLDYLAGRLSDRTGKRKIFAIAGYGFSTLAKTILLISSSIAGLSAFRVIERLGKSFRGPPRDAWLAGIAGKKTRGYAFGIHKALDKSGAVLGPLLAYGLLKRFG